MTHALPTDADGDALRRVQGQGSDMSRPMAIDFTVVVPDVPAADAVLQAVTRAGYAARQWKDDESGELSCICTRTMVPTYEAVITAQAELDALAKPFAGYTDGWGTFGNAETFERGRGS